MLAVRLGIDVVVIPVRKADFSLRCSVIPAVAMLAVRLGIDAVTA